MMTNEATLMSKVWSQAAFHAVNGTSFDVTDLPFCTSQRAIVRKTLREMEQLGWLQREADRDSVWHPGPTTAGFTSKQLTATLSQPVEYTSELDSLDPCPNCGVQLSSEDRGEGPDHPEVGWEYYECSCCGNTIRADAVEAR